MTRESEFLAAYDAERLVDQQQWYRRRADEYLGAERQGEVLRATLLGLAAICGGFGAADFGREPLGVVAVVLAVLATMVSSWMDLVGFRANADLYEAAVGGLAHLRPERPDDSATSSEILGYVTSVERVLLGEVATWSESWGERAKPGGSPADPVDRPAPPGEPGQPKGA